jgi:hypothetical protein
MEAHFALQASLQLLDDLIGAMGRQDRLSCTRLGRDKRALMQLLQDLPLSRRQIQGEVQGGVQEECPKAVERVGKVEADDVIHSADRDEGGEGSREDRRWCTDLSKNAPSIIWRSILVVTIVPREGELILRR